MNKIGFNVLAWSAGISDKLLPVTERLKKIGYDGVEFAIDNQSPAVYKRFGEQVQEQGLEVTCVLVVGADENPVSDSAVVRAKAVDRSAKPLIAPRHWVLKSSAGHFILPLLLFRAVPLRKRNIAAVPRYCTQPGNMRQKQISS
jgi:hypothetical protein